MDILFCLMKKKKNNISWFWNNFLVFHFVYAGFNLTFSLLFHSDSIKTGFYVVISQIKFFLPLIGNKFNIFGYFVDFNEKKNIFFCLVFTCLNLCVIFFFNKFIYNCSNKQFNNNWLIEKIFFSFFCSFFILLFGYE